MGALSLKRGGSTSAVRGDRKEHTSELQSRLHLVCRLLLEKKKKKKKKNNNIQYTKHKPQNKPCSHQQFIARHTTHNDQNVHNYQNDLSTRSNNYTDSSS